VTSYSRISERLITQDYSASGPIEGSVEGSVEAPWKVPERFLTASWKVPRRFLFAVSLSKKYLWSNQKEELISHSCQT
jgi:hypothetical protein